MPYGAVYNPGCAALCLLYFMVVLKIAAKWASWYTFMSKKHYLKREDE